MKRYSVERADPNVHRQHVLALAERNLPGRFESRFAKYYSANPLAPPALFIAQDTTAQSFVGMAALLPASVRVAGQLVRGGMAGDFAVDASHRGFGPALPLQRSLLSLVSDNDVRFVYGTPNEASEPLFQRLGYADLGRFTRFVRFFRVDPVVRRYTRRRRVAALASAVAAPVLGWRARERRYRPSGRFSVEKPAAFDERFDSLWEASWRQYRVVGERTSELLNWKYAHTNGDAEDSGYSLFALLAEGNVAGYIAFSTRNDVRHIVDLLCLDSQAVVDALLAEFLLDARRASAAAVGFLYLGGRNLLTRRLRAFRFLERSEPSGLVVFVPDESPFAGDLRERSNWYFVAGDGDIV